MRRKRLPAPTAGEWTSLANALMQYEWLMEQRHAARAARRARWLDVEHEPAYAWLAAHAAYAEALAAYRRLVGEDDSLRFELVSAIAYSMDALHSRTQPEVADAPARRTALRHARALAALVAASASADLDEHYALRLMLERYIEREEHALRTLPDSRRDGSPQLRFAEDLARVLWTSLGRAPARVVAPLMQLAGPAVSDRRTIAALLARAKREAQRLESGPLDRKPRFVLERITLRPTRQTRKPQRSAR